MSRLDAYHTRARRPARNCGGVSFRGPPSRAGRARAARRVVSRAAAARLRTSSSTCCSRRCSARAPRTSSSTRSRTRRGRCPSSSCRRLAPSLNTSGLASLESSSRRRPTTRVASASRARPVGSSLLCGAGRQPTRVTARIFHPARAGARPRRVEDACLDLLRRRRPVDAAAARARARAVRRVRCGARHARRETLPSALHPFRSSPVCRAVRRASRRA